ncbi:MAG: hypothetical protein A2511_04735 [Deltaproteobacteria bacterium RIFOXYD12_FULL_50_9]|nr:MAG: hypothetical protein A2511_04735 [Deltaproteobacteria bacterium RIFOXYD12_FULL_50_9]
MKAWLYHLNNFAHDLFTGIWCGCFVNLVALRSWSDSGLMTGPAHDLARLMFGMGAGALAAVLTTGIFRYIYRFEWQQTEQLALAKKPVLIVKHIILGLLFLVGSLLAVFWVFP